MQSHDLPKGAIYVRTTARSRRRVERLAERWDCTLTDAVNRAVIHALASVELREEVHTFVPSERGGEEERGS
jgi:hypothetical protein